MPLPKGARQPVFLPLVVLAGLSSSRAQPAASGIPRAKLESVFPKRRAGHKSISLLQLGPNGAGTAQVDLVSGNGKPMSLLSVSWNLLLALGFQWICLLPAAGQAFLMSVTTVSMGVFSPFVRPDHGPHTGSAFGSGVNSALDHGSEKELRTTDMAAGRN